MVYLFLGLAALFGGFAALPVMRARPQWMSVLGGFVVASVGGLVMMHLIPHSLEKGGALAVFAAALGLMAPILAERVTKRQTPSKGLWTLGVGMVLAGLFVHAFVDGAALALPEVHDAAHKHEHGHDGELLALGVLLHRLPVGLGIGWALMPRWGLKGALAVVSGVAVATVLGFFLGLGTLMGLGEEGLAVFQAAVAGILLHVVFMHAPPKTKLSRKRTRILGASGAAAGLAMIVGLELVAEAEPFGFFRGLAFVALTVLTMTMFLRADQRSFLGTLFGHRDHAPESDTVG